MTLIVEDGSGVAGANGYVSMDECSDYCVARGLTFATSPSSLGEGAIVRGTAAIDAIYRGRFPGYRTKGRAQSLEWPRGQAYDVEGLMIAVDEIPQELKEAVCEAAVREFATPGSMRPDLERGGAIRSLRAGSVEITYGANADPNTVHQLIGGILSGILQTGSGEGMFGVAVRG